MTTALLLAETTEPVTERLCVNPRHERAAVYLATLSDAYTTGTPEGVCASCANDLQFATKLSRSLRLTLAAI